MCWYDERGNTNYLATWEPFKSFLIFRLPYSSQLRHLWKRSPSNLLGLEVPLPWLVLSIWAARLAGFGLSTAARGWIWLFIFSENLCAAPWVQGLSFYVVCCGCSLAFWMCIGNTDQWWGDMKPELTRGTCLAVPKANQDPKGDAELGLNTLPNGEKKK